MTRRAGALLPVHLLAGAVDFAPVLDVMGAALTLGELPAHATVQDIGARLQTEDGVRQVHPARRRAVEGRDFELHFKPHPWLPSARLLQRLPGLHPRRLLHSSAVGTCPAWGPHPAAASSRHREE